MPFAKCKQCGRLFHTFEPLLPDAPERFGPNLSQGDDLLELCPECFDKRRDNPVTGDSNKSDRGDSIN